MQNKILLNDLLLLTNSHCVINLHANKQLLNGEYVCSNIRIVVRMPTLTASYFVYTCAVGLRVYPWCSIVIIY